MAYGGRARRNRGPFVVVIPDTEHHVRQGRSPAASRGGAWARRVFCAASGCSERTFFQRIAAEPAVLYRPRMSKRTVRVVAAVVAVDGRYLVTQRRSSAVLPNLWEFPGGRVEHDENDAAALRREIHERLGVHVDVGQMISFVSHPYEQYKVDLYLYECRLVSGELRARGVQAFRWITSEEFDSHDFAPADEASMSQLLGEDESRH
jgi:8-oxo-dGTP diphosphatase